MGNILDYLDWRGDLSLGQDPFNDVDNLILASLSYLEFDGVVPGIGEGSISLSRAAEEFFSRYPLGEKVDMGLVVPAEVPAMLEKMARTERFGAMRLSCYVNHVDQKASEQFSALTVETGDRQIYCAFRGTDDTLAGWREDLEMACTEEIPAQKLAADYLRKTARCYPRRGIRLGGHSKGGNLAVYAAALCPQRLQHRITVVWSNDGPGFYEEALNSPGYGRVRDRLHSVIPKASVVGMLLDHDTEDTVVDSDQLGVLQHNPFSWQVMGGGFVVLPEMDRGAREGSLAIREWMKKTTPEGRNRFVEALFSVLTAGGAETLTDLKDGDLRDAGAVVRAMKDMDRETREGILEFMQLLVANNTKLVLEGLRQELEKLRKK